jgi:hypothetical protein
VPGLRVTVDPVAEPEDPSRVTIPEEPVAVIVITFPEPDVVAPVPPRTSRTFARGTAVPLLVTKLVGIWGFTLILFVGPAWLI